MNTRNFVAVVEEENMNQIESIAKLLAEQGCIIDRVMPVLGVITGSVSSTVSLKDLIIKGIKYIDPERSITTLNKGNRSELK